MSHQNVVGNQDCNITQPVKKCHEKHQTLNPIKNSIGEFWCICVFGGENKYG
jgi:hypothetical protein